MELWFDVGIKRYTTLPTAVTSPVELWFDVGIKRYTTFFKLYLRFACCGLM